METNKSVKITNCKQFECLVQLMEKNVGIAKGFFSFGSSKTEYNGKWNSFAAKLNSLGPPIREGVGWQKVWNDLKNKITNKLAHNKREVSGTGGGSNKLYVFSPLEESVISLLCYERITSTANRSYGLARKTPSETHPEPNLSSDVFGEQSTEENIAADLELNVAVEEDVTLEEPQTEIIEEAQILAPISRNTRRSRNNFQEERQKFLEMQTKSAQETEKNTRDCARYLRKIYEIKHEKFKMWKEIQLGKKRCRQQNMEYKIRTIEYKERKLALKENRSN